MKKHIRIYILFTAMVLAGTVTVNAQKKASDKTFAEEMKKVNEKKTARYNYINKTRQSTPDESQAPGSTDQPANTGPGADLHPTPGTTNQAPANLKPSQQVMRAPKRPV